MAARRPSSPSHPDDPIPSYSYPAALREENHANNIDDDDRDVERGKSLKTSLLRRAERSHRRLPVLRKVPLPAIGIILLIAVINVVVWVVAGIVLAIDLMTRRLLATGQKPVTVGTFFSLGHSTIVIITSIVVAATAAAVSSRFDRFSTVGGIIGSSVSSAFLILLGIMNGYILYKLIKQMQKVLSLQEGEEEEAWKIEGGGCLFSVLKKMFKLIDRPWKMYPLGVLFGLGFDTSSEIALLGISSIQAARGTSFWVILIFPALFTAGMCLLDTLDGALMLSLYIQPAAIFLPAKTDSSTSELITSSDNILTPESRPGAQPSRNPRDPLAFLYYSIVLTTLTVIVAIVIGVLQLLTLILNAAEPKGKFWDGVETAGEYYDVIGGSICGCFIIVGILSVFLYRPWRRWVDKKYGRDSGRVLDEEERYRDADTDDDVCGGNERLTTNAEQGRGGNAVQGSEAGVTGKDVAQVAVKPAKDDQEENLILAG
ncbi:hypothetical protein VTN00DRAFT_2649 [Thermoascus crustaceus]|uniref:uncharacterized protein n=1 Tax=Thermoascus crustaceus TaxID=5088 RepID=UPI00374367EE